LDYSLRRGRHLPRRTLLPYTTLFRSAPAQIPVPAPVPARPQAQPPARHPAQAPAPTRAALSMYRPPTFSLSLWTTLDDGLEAARSEEHTSELQSRENLVCRLLREKKH